jgi:cobalt-zinc-cadmium efflux system membrane fusion protein
MNKVLKILNIIALVAVAFFVGRMILHSANHGDAAKEEPAEEAAAEEGPKDFVPISDEKLNSAKITTSAAGPQVLERRRSLFGQFRANEENVAHIAPRFAGVIQSVSKRLGDKVEKGETVVVIESNESLETYEVKSLISGTVIFREAQRGEAVTEGQRLLTVSDLSTLWVDLSAYPQDYHILKLGQSVEITAPALDKPMEAKIDYVSPFGAEGTQTMLARVTIPNPDQHLRPGLFAEGSIYIGKEEVSLAVKNVALQTWEGHDVIFVKEGEGYKAKPVELGRSDGEATEILSGLKAGETYAAENSFLLKAELGKSMAEED